MEFLATNVNTPIFLISDGTGETARSLLNAVLAQYGNMRVHRYAYKNIVSVEQVESILKEAKIQNAPVIYTVVIPEVRVALEKGVNELGVKAYDALGPALELVSEVYSAEPSAIPGLLHKVDEGYFRKIEAMEFVVKNDDGSMPENLKNADLVLVGVSRTSKTPLSIFLSHRGWKVANIPLVPGIQPPEELFAIDQNKVVALTINPEALSQIRHERLIRMGRSPTEDYARVSRIREEIDWAQDLFSRNRKWPVFDVTNKALEETAAEIERRMRARFKNKK